MLFEVIGMVSCNVSLYVQVCVESRFIKAISVTPPCETDDYRCVPRTLSIYVRSSCAMGSINFVWINVNV